MTVDSSAVPYARGFIDPSHTLNLAEGTRLVGSASARG